MINEDFLKEYNPHSSIDNAEIFSKSHSLNFEQPDNSCIYDIFDNSEPKSSPDHLDQLACNTQSEVKNLLKIFKINIISNTS